MNAVRHGLGMSLSRDAAYNSEIEGLAFIFAEGCEDPGVQACARLLAEACLDVQRIELVKTLILNRVLNDPEPRPPTLKELTTGLHYARIGMVRAARVRAAQEKIKRGRATKRDIKLVEEEPVWQIYYNGHVNDFLKRSDRNDGRHFERAAKELAKLNRYHQRALAKRRRALREMARLIERT